MFNLQIKTSWIFRLSKTSQAIEVTANHVETSQGLIIFCIVIMRFDYAQQFALHLQIFHFQQLLVIEQGVGRLSFEQL